MSTCTGGEPLRVSLARGVSLCANGYKVLPQISLSADVDPHSWIWIHQRSSFEGVPVVFDTESRKLRWMKRSFFLSAGWSGGVVAASTPAATAFLLGRRRLVSSLDKGGGGSILLKELHEQLRASVLVGEVLLLPQFPYPRFVRFSFSWRP